jgi:hypothetical protein
MGAMASNTGEKESHVAARRKQETGVNRLIKKPSLGQAFDYFQMATGLPNCKTASHRMELHSTLQLKLSAL